MKSHRPFLLAWICLAVSLLFTGGLNGQISSTSSSTRPISEQFRWMPVPATLTSPGKPGDFASDGTDLYIYTGTGRPPHSWIVAGSGGGSGTVTSVNGVLPVGGAVTLTPANIGAMDENATFARVGTSLATNGLRAIPATEAGFDTYILALDTDTTPALTFTDPVSAPSEKYGYSLKVIGKAASSTVITIPSSYSEEQQANITTITVQAGVEFTCYRMYLNGRWHIYGEPAPGSYSNGVKLLRAGGSAVVAETFPVAEISASVNMTDGRLGLQAIYIDRAATLTTMKWYCSVNANFSADQSNHVGLYSINTGTNTATLIASSASANLTWDQSVNTWTTRTFSASVDVVPGWYYIGYVYNSSAQTTAPGTGGRTALLNAAVAGLITNLPLSCYLSSQNSLPSSVNLTTVTADTVQRYFQVY